MKTLIATVVAAVGASVCCLGPVALSLIGAGTIGAAATRLESWRPALLGLTALLLGAAFVATYRRSGDACTTDGTCTPAARRRAQVRLWLVAIVVLALVAFPYYISWLL